LGCWVRGGGFEGRDRKPKTSEKKKKIKGLREKGAKVDKQS